MGGFAMAHQSFATTSRGLRRDTPPMVLFEKAKLLGIWNPTDIDFTQDKVDWRRLKDDEREVLLRLTSQFQAGEEAVTLDLLPLIGAVAKQGHIEEEMFLTTFLWEEAKHVDFFQRFLTDVVGEVDTEHLHDPNYRHIFYHVLPEALLALESDPSPHALAKASTTYNLVIEGMLAETGYHIYFNVLDGNKILPGQRKGIALLKQDESRHIAYGIFLLSRLMAEDETVWDVIESTMGDLLQPALGLISDAFAHYEIPPFGIKEEDYLNYAMRQFEKRLERIRKCRGLTMDEVYTVHRRAIEENDA
jgi:ribonucleoside-diphosphate reductase beta chain